MKQTVIFAAESSAQSDHAVNTGERLVNVYPEIVGEGARSRIVLRTVPGLASNAVSALIPSNSNGSGADQYATSTSTPIRIKAVSGPTILDTSQLFILAQADSATTGARLVRVTNPSSAPSSSLVYSTSSAASDLNFYNGLLDSTTDASFTAGSEYHTFDKTAGTGAKPTGGAITATAGITFLNNYVLVSGSSSGTQGRQFEWLTLADPGTRAALNVGTKEGYADPIQQILASQGNVYVFGTSSVEMWSLTGQANDDAFARNSNFVADIGLLNPRLIVDYKDSIYFVSENSVVYRLRGFSFERVSTSAIEAKVGSHVAAFAYSYEGHDFICFWNNVGPTFVYDATTGFWHERVSGSDPDGIWNICDMTTAANGITYALHYDGTVYRVQGDVNDAGTAITRTIVSRPLDINGDVFRVANLQVRAQPDDTSYDIDMRHSRDGGRNWSTARTYSMTSTNRSGRARWNGLGSGRLFQVELTLGDAVGAPIEAEAVIEVT